MVSSRGNASALRLDNLLDGPAVAVRVGEEDEAAPGKVLAAEWEASLANQFTAAELTRITEFLRLTNEVGKRHLDRLAKES